MPRWALLRRAAAALAVVTSGMAIALLFAEWHVVRVHAIDAEKVFAALYMGPDLRIDPETRATFLADGLDAGVAERVCTGLAHLGDGPLVALIVLLGLASAALLAPRGRTSCIAAVATVIAGIVAIALLWHAEFLRHLFEDVGPDTNAVALFRVAFDLAIAAALSLGTAACIELRLLRRAAADRVAPR